MIQNVSSTTAQSNEVQELTPNEIFDLMSKIYLGEDCVTVLTNQIEDTINNLIEDNDEETLDSIVWLLRSYARKADDALYEMQKQNRR